MVLFLQNITANFLVAPKSLSYRVSHWEKTENEAGRAKHLQSWNSHVVASAVDAAFPAGAYKIAVMILFSLRLMWHNT